MRAWRLAVGTLTAWPVAPPGRVDRPVAGRAMLLAPFAVLPLGLVVAGILWAGRELELSGLAVAAVAVGALALGSRALHLDGLSDVADGLTASYHRERSLEIMKGGTAGPAGAATLVLVLVIQAAAIASMTADSWGPALAGLLVCLSRASLVLCCAQGVPAARPDGLAVTYAGSVSRGGVVLMWAGVVMAVTVALGVSDASWWRGAVVAAAGLVAAAVVLRRCVVRFGGVTGDVFGATIEISLAAMLVAAS